MTNLVLYLSVTGEGECTIYSIIKDKYLHAVTSLLFTKERSKDTLFFSLSLNFTQQTFILLLSYATEKKYTKSHTHLEKLILFIVQDFYTRNTRYIGHSESNS